MRLVVTIAVLLCGGCASSYPGPAPGLPSAEISFTALEGEKAHEVDFRLMRESSSDNCFGPSKDLAYANVGLEKFLRGGSRGLSGVTIPADKEIEIRLDIRYRPFWFAGNNLINQDFDVAFTPAHNHRYRMDLEWDKDYIDVYLVELAADGGVHRVPFRLEECRHGWFTTESVIVEPD